MPPGFHKNQPEQEPEIEFVVEVEIDPEHTWRCERLVELGFSDHQAFLLSIGGADWHDAKRLLDAGCAADDVVNILT